MKPDPMGLPRNPFHVFLFVVAALNGLAISFGESTSGALEDALNETFLCTYGFLLAIGSMAVLGGMFWPGDRRTGLLWKRTGYVGLSFATFIYGLAIVQAKPTVETLLAGSITLAFSGICAWQVWYINRHVLRAIRLGEGR